MAYSTLASRVDLADKHYPPARSIPNLSNNVNVPIVPKSDSFHMGRSSSQPPETWCRDNEQDENETDDKSIILTSAAATQTDNKIDVTFIEQFILANPRIVLNLLGIDSPYVEIIPKILPISTQMHSLIPIPESTGNSPDATSPQQQQHLQQPQDILDNDFIGSSAITNESVWSPKNSSYNSNHHHRHHHSHRGGDTCRSTDALLDDSSDEYFRSKENLSNINETINFNIIREGSQKFFRSNRNSIERSDKLSNSSSSGGAGDNSVTSIAPLSPDCDNSKQISNCCNNSTSNSNNHHQLHRLSNRRDSSSSSCNNSRKNSYQTTANQHEPMLSKILVDIQTDFDDTNNGEKQALLSGCCNTSMSHRSSTTEIHKRGHLAPRQPVNYRFSAGDADKLEKGIRTHPSTRSLKES